MIPPVNQSTDLKPLIIESRPFVKPEGNFKSPKLFNTKKEAEKYQSLNGGIVFNYFDGSFVVVYVKETN